jgi:endonuclease YncB( thermonuclease family)
MHDRPAFYVTNHDGDTITLILDQDFYDMKRINVRLANVWAPELKQPGGPEVRAYVNEWCTRRMDRDRSVSWPFVVHTLVTAKDTQVKSFDRYVATVMSRDGKESLNADVMKFIIEKGYTGGIGSISR